MWDADGLVLPSNQHKEWGGSAMRDEEMRKRTSGSVRDEGKRKRSCPKHRWKDTIKKDLQSCTMTEEDAQDWSRWKCLIKLGCQQKPATWTGHDVDKMRLTPEIILYRNVWISHMVWSREPGYPTQHMMFYVTPCQYINSQYVQLMNFISKWINAQDSF